MKSRALNDLRVARLRLRKPVRDDLPKPLPQGIKACDTIVTDRARWPELGSGRGQARFKFAKSYRERDLRRLEACVLVLKCGLSHLDLVRRRIGRPRRDGSCDAIAVPKRRPRKGFPFVEGQSERTSFEAETGISAGRIWRALRDLVDAGLLEPHKQCKKYEDEETGELRYFRFPTVYTVTALCFQRLGITAAQLEEAGRGARKREISEPDPIVDIVAERERRKVVRASQRLAAKRVQLPAEAAAARARRKRE